MSYGNLIKAIRVNKNMSLRQFGEYVGISHMHISRLEREFSDKGKERLKVPIDELKQICDRTNYPFRQFLEEAGYIEPIPPSTPHPLVTMYDRMPPLQKDQLVLFAKGLLGEEPLNTTPEGYFDLSHILDKN